MEKKEFFGDRLSELMVTNQISNKKLAEDFGVNASTVHHWKNGGFVRLSRLQKLADYFNCSLDFLAGRSDVVLDYVPKECPPFYDRFREVLKESGKTRYSLDRDSKFKDSYFTHWRKTNNPNLDTLIELADNLGVTIDYLVGRDR